MAQTITIDPVTRIEGHGKITIYLNDSGEVENAQFHVTQLRGFEKFVVGRPFHEMPSLMARICGICPVSHLIASAKTCDALMAVTIPPAAKDLRRIMNHAQVAQSHALSFFYLSSPDLLLGMDADPAERNVLALARTNPELARDGIRLRQYGQQIIEMLGGKRIHPAWVVPGGVSEPLTTEKRDRILTMIPDALARVRRTLDWFKGTLDHFQEEIATFANFPTLFMGLVSDDNQLSLYDGHLRIVDANGRLIADRLKPENYQEFIAEAVEPHSFLKSPYYKPFGYVAGMYRVGPLARLNVVDRCGTPLADMELDEFRKQDRRSSFHFHYARLIEMLYVFERIEKLLLKSHILDTHVRAYASPNNFEGIGASEAPRGTLLHHYRIDKHGIMQDANLIIATGNNNLAMNRGVLEVAKHFVKADRLTEGMLNRVEAVIRTFDPCLSCSTHAIGKMPLHVQLLNPAGEVVDQLVRG
jgi:NAD-reducing hydrogenase large subunit